VTLPQNSITVHKAEVTAIRNRQQLCHTNFAVENSSLFTVKSCQLWMLGVLQTIHSGRICKCSCHAV